MVRTGYCLEEPCTTSVPRLEDVSTEERLQQVALVPEPHSWTYPVPVPPPSAPGRVRSSNLHMAQLGKWQDGVGGGGRDT